MTTRKAPSEELQSCPHEDKNSVMVILQNGRLLQFCDLECLTWGLMSTVPQAKLLARLFLGCEAQYKGTQGP